jgi:hypothetical protein
MIIRTFEHRGKQYALTHDLDDDSRNVHELSDEKMLLRFDSSMRIYDSEKKYIGGFSSMNNTWSLTRPDMDDLDLKVQVRDFHWKNIEDAEIEAAKVFLS